MKIQHSYANKDRTIEFECGLKLWYGGKICGDLPDDEIKAHAKVEHLRRCPNCKGEKKCYLKT